jgi:hypothetical protein
MMDDLIETITDIIFDGYEHAKPKQGGQHDEVTDDNSGSGSVTAGTGSVEGNGD